MTQLRELTEILIPPARSAAGHKGTFGKVLIVAGSLGMTGAAILAGKGALRSGAGLLWVATPEPCQPIVASGEPAYLTLGLPVAKDSPGELLPAAREQVLQQASGMQALAIGPGWGRDAIRDELTCELFRTSPLPLVVDADGLNALADHPDRLGQHAGPRVLTPHPGEFARLIGRTVAEVQQQRVELATEFARQHNLIVVLKGQGTVVTAGEDYSINPTGNDGMATGGTGDVLTGVLAGLLAQGMEPLAAARFGVYLHGLAGDLAAAELSRPGLIASDLPNYLPRAWRQLLGE
jgi:NAD(P)H-hydrate epimerase